MQGHHHFMVMPLHIFIQSRGRRPLPAPRRFAARENPMDSFGSRLRYERERRQIALKSIAESTKISVTLLEGLERDDVSRWPSGIFRKSFIRSYAEAVGLKPDPIVREFIELYPDPLEVEVAASSPAARVLNSSTGTTESARPSSSASPLAIKLTITWNGSVHHTIGRLADWKIVRLLLDWRESIGGMKARRLGQSISGQSEDNLTIYQSSNLPMLISPRESEGAVPDQIRPA
jgi:transcriptional regulator with XRE-family HTH domain